MDALVNAAEGDVFAFAVKSAEAVKLKLDGDRRRE
jgi:hypothetical protein